MTQVLYKVKAIRMGQYNHKRIVSDMGGKSVFYIKHAKDFSPNWMESLDKRLDAELAKLSKERSSRKGPEKAPAKKNADKVDIIDMVNNPAKKGKSDLDETVVDESNGEVENEVEPPADESDVTSDDEAGSDDVI